MKLACTVLLALVGTAVAHPSGLASGRASCGTEFHTPEDAYVIEDPTEARYLRRIATCSAPFFWTSFTTTSVRKEREEKGRR